MGGTTPISGSSVDLCVSTQTIGSSNPQDINCSSSLGSGVSDSQGSSTISYSAPASGLVYVVASGGDAGGGNNPYIKLVASVGYGGNVLPSITVNEATTTAVVSSVRPMIGQTISNSLFMENISHGVSRFVSQPSGQFVTSTSTQAGTGDGVLSYLSNVLASCVNSSAPGTDCPSLFGTIKTAAGSSLTPSNTVQAAFLVFGKPAANYSSLTQGSTGPYGSTSAPQTFSPTVLAYGGSYYSTYLSPFYSAVDANGNLWVTSCYGSGNFAVTEMVSSNNYSPVTIASDQTVTTSVMNMPTMPAIDASGNVWISNDFAGQNFLTEIQPGNNNAISTHLLPASDNQGGFDVSIDTSGNVWVQGYSNSSTTGYPEVGMLSSTNPTSSFAYQAGAAGSGSDAMAVDGNGNVWIADCVNNTLTKLVPTGGTSYSYNNYSVTGLLNPAGIAIDPSNNVWIADSDCGAGAANILELPGGDVSTPTSYSTTTITGSSTSFPISLASDSLGNIWAVDYNMNELIELENNAGAYTGIVAGHLPSGQTFPHGISIDSNGNIWVTDNGNRTNFTGGGVVEFVGMAAPVKTPLIGVPTAP